jgi:ATP-dependent DNA helicase RecG
MNTPSKTIERWVKKLRDDGKVEFKGGKKTGGYYLISKIHYEARDKTK